jgi:oligoendopeptidase F
MYTAAISKKPRHFVPADFTVTTWDKLEVYYKDLLDRPIDTPEAFEQWLKDCSELEAVVSEDVCWRQIKMTCDTENKALEEHFNYFYTELDPHLQPYSDAINKKLVNHPLAAQLDAEKYFTYLRSTRKSIELFKEENVPLHAELTMLQQQYGMVTGKMTVEVGGKEYTLQQASKFLQGHDRALREEVYRKMQERRLQDKDTLNELYSTLIAKRQQVAQNAGFTDYRGYRFKELGRFDYGYEQCYDFHQAVKEHVLPLVNKIFAAKKAQLGLDTLRPWDLDAEPVGTEPLRPFATGSELLDKTIDCFAQLRPFFADCLRRMQEMQQLDLESRKGKAPGGYNCPLAESGAPFIFMNAAGQMGDVITMVHEGGHAVHSFLAHPLELNGFKDYPMEIAEVASMAMELFSMDHWDSFFSDANELRRAKEYQLEKVIVIFPWIAIIDKFQHWVYEHPTHSLEERTAAWVGILQEFSDSVVDYSGLETYRSNGWQKQLHLFEVPFYYIEYGIAQLGAIGLWMQYKQNKEQALDNYCQALALGGTQTLPQLYEAAGLSFDFSPGRIKVLMDFVSAELDKL